MTTQNSKLKTQNSNRGAILIVTILVLVILLFVVTYFLDLVTTGSRVSKSYSLASQAYYLAEAGVNEAIWKLKNDPTWETKFENDPDWEIGPGDECPECTRSPALYPNGSYTIHVKNTDKAEGQITVVGRLDIGSGRQAQRVVKIKVFKAEGQNPVGDAALYGNGDVIFWASIAEVIGEGTPDPEKPDGSIFTNRDMNLEDFQILWWVLESDVTVENQALAARNINVDENSNLDASDKCSKGECTDGCVKCPPDERQMPGVDFNTDNPNSYLSRAVEVYTGSEFAEKLRDNPNLTLPESGSGIVYVKGNICLLEGQNLTIDGALVAENSITIGGLLPATLTIERTDGQQPAGLLTQRDIYIWGNISEIDIEGLVYANNQILIVSPFGNIDIDGGMIARETRFEFVRGEQQLKLKYNNERIKKGLGIAEFSPVISINHWEEKY